MWRRAVVTAVTRASGGPSAVSGSAVTTTTTTSPAPPPTTTNVPDRRRCLSTTARSSAGDSTTRAASSSGTGSLVTNEPSPAIPDVRITDLLWHKFEGCENETAVVCSETGRSYSYGKLRHMAEALGHALRVRLNIPAGSAVAVVLPNVPEYASVVLGIIRAGLVMTSVNPAYTADEIHRQLVDSGARALITLSSGADASIAAVKSCAGAGEPSSANPIPVITIKNRQDDRTPGGCVDMVQLCSSYPSGGWRIPASEEAASSPKDQVILLPYSSGTTGLPKGVKLTHRNIVANLTQSSRLDSMLRDSGNDPQPVVPAVLPLFHIYGMTVLLMKSLSLGAKIVTVPKFTPDGFADMMMEHRPHTLFLVPPIVLYLASHQKVTRRHLDSVRCVISGAAPLGATDAERLLNRAQRPVPCLQGYGMTETSPAITFTHAEHWQRWLGSVGKPLPATECKVVPADSEGLGPHLPENEPGELVVRGPQVMLGYHNRDKETRETLLPGGWLRTGDMVYYDAEGVVWITDRLKELIKVKGYQVAPAELEAILRSHPSLADAAVVGVPHARNGEAPRAFVVAKEGEPTPSPQTIQEFVSGQVAAYKRLEGGVVYVKEIPKNAAGKILRRQLRDSEKQ